ncbi:MAG: type II toxin-antitoxin system VapC family toxin [Verrucomicrobiota bacterium]
MIPAPVLDTHIWIWWMLGDPRLKQVEREALDALPPHARPVLCDISLWEFATLVDLGRVEIHGGIEDWLQVAASPATVRVQPILPGIVAEMNRLPASFHRDPADRLIVASARFLKLPLATQDRKIRCSKLIAPWTV